MTGSPYRVYGLEISDCLGRCKILRRVHDELTNNHVSIIGSRHSGKTVLLHRLAAEFAEQGSSFSGCIFWNLKEKRYTCDDDFLKDFRRRLVDPITRLNSDLAAYLEAEDLSAFEAIQMVFEELHKSAQSLVICMDDFDALPIGTALTADLLGNLRSLIVKWTKSLRFVIGSRNGLRDACASADTAGSPFHNLFADDPIVLKSVPLEQIGEFVTPFPRQGITIIAGVEKEIFNWSGGSPILISMLCKRLWARCTPGNPLTADMVNEEGAELQGDPSGYLKDLWNDCTPEEKEILNTAASGPIFSPPGAARFTRALIDRGYLVRIGDRVQFQCRTMLSIVKGELGAQSALMATLFGTPARFAQNARELLRYQLASRTAIDEQLVRTTAKIIDGFDDPNTSIALFREAARQMFNIVWARVLPSRRIPQDWTEHWQNLRDQRAERVTALSGPVHNDGSQCRLLDQLTGPNSPAETCIRRSTYVLLNALWGIGDYSQHHETEIIEPGFFVWACNTLLDTWANLESDLRRPLLTTRL